MTLNLERFTRPIVPLVTALAALLASCTALWKAVDKTVERKGYETTTRAIEDLRKENDELRKSVEHFERQSLIEVIDEASDSLLIAPTSSATPSAAPSASAAPLSTAALAMKVSAAPAATSPTVHISAKPKTKIVFSPLPSASASAAPARPPLPAWGAL